MKYTPSTESIPQSSRRAVNEKLLYLIDNNCCEAYGITKQDVFQGYTGDGGLHGLSRKNYRSYHTYSEAKKELENGQFFTPPALCQFVADCLRLEEDDLVADLTCGNWTPRHSRWRHIFIRRPIWLIRIFAIICRRYALIMW